MNEQEEAIHSFYGCDISIEIFVQKKAPKAWWKLCYFRGLMYYRTMSNGADIKIVLWKYFIFNRCFPKKLIINGIIRQ